MAKRKRKMTDREALKHYTAGGGLLPSSETATDADMSALARELVDESLTSKPAFIKPVLAIDRAMAERKSAVLKPRKEPKHAKND